MNDMSGSAPPHADTGASGDQGALILEPLRRGDENEVAHLHATFFTGEAHGHSIANLGERFMERVFYGLNADNPYFFCDVARYSGKIVGFSVYTNDRRSLFRQTLRRHPLRLMIELMRTLAGQPRAVASLASNMHYTRGERLPDGADVPGWWLLLGVLPRYRSREFVERTGHQIALGLADRMEATLRELECPAWYAAPHPWNEAINKFLSRRGAELVGSSTAQGLEVVYYVKRLDLDGPQSASSKRIPS